MYACTHELLACVVIATGVSHKSRAVVVVAAVAVGVYITTVRVTDLYHVGGSIIRKAEGVPWYPSCAGGLRFVGMEMHLFNRMNKSAAGDFRILELSRRLPNSET